MIRLENIPRGSIELVSFPVFSFHLRLLCRFASGPAASLHWRRERRTRFYSFFARRPDVPDTPVLQFTLACSRPLVSAGMEKQISAGHLRVLLNCARTFKLFCSCVLFLPLVSPRRDVGDVAILAAVFCLRCLPVEDWVVSPVSSRAGCLDSKRNVACYHAPRCAEPVRLTRAPLLLMVMLTEFSFFLSATQWFLLCHRRYLHLHSPPEPLLPYRRPFCRCP